MKCVVAKGDEIKTTIVKWKNIQLRYYSKFNEMYKCVKMIKAHIMLRKKCKNTFLTLNKIVNKGIYAQLSS